MLVNRRHQVVPAGTTITTTGNSGQLGNLSRGLAPIIVVVLDVQGPVTGTSPSLTISVSGWTDGNCPALLGTMTAVTSVLSGPQRLVLNNVLEDELMVTWTVTGTNPSFGNVSVDLIMPSPDA